MKQKGNIEFGLGNFPQSVLYFGEAISYCPTEDNEEMAIYYNNRGLASLKLEKKEEEALEDFKQAIELNENYVKPRF